MIKHTGLTSYIVFLNVILRELAPSYNEYLNYIHPDDRDRFDNSVKETLKGKNSVTEDEHRIVLAGGEERTIHMEIEVIFDERNIPTKVKGTNSGHYRTQADGGDSASE